MIDIEKLSGSLGDFRLRDIDLRVGENEYFVILGPTGAGKTVLLETIAGFHTPEQGRISLKGTDISYRPPEKRRIGIVYQNYLLFPHKTVFDNIAYGLRLRKMKATEIEKEVRAISSKLGISHILERYPGTLSGGEAQRVSMARALVLDPEVLLLDEPLSALDQAMRKEVMKELKRVHRESDTTFIHVTHNQQEALELGDRIGVMNDGRMVQVGTPDEIFRRPKSEFLANFVAVDNLFSGNAGFDGELTRVEIGEHMMYSTDRIEGDVHATIRPEDILVSKREMESSARNSFKGRISGISDLGATVRLKVDGPLEFSVLITRRSFHDMELNIGSEVHLSFKATAVNLF